MSTLEEIAAQVRAQMAAQKTQGGEAVPSAAAPISDKPGLKHIKAGISGIEEAEINSMAADARRERLVDQVHTASGRMINGIPVVGPLLHEGAQRAAAGTVAAFDGDKEYADVLAEMKKQENESNERNPGISTAASLAGTVGGAMAFPTPQSLGGALGAAIGLSEADLAARKAVEDGRLPTGQEAAVAAGMSAGGTAIGWYMGKGVGFLWDKFMGKNHPLPDTALKHVESLHNTYKKAGKTMDDAGIQLNPKSLERLYLHIERQAKDAGLDPDMTKTAWASLNMLRNKILSGDIKDLTKFNDVRVNIRDSISSNSAPLDDKVNRAISGLMKRYIDNLPRAIPGRATFNTRDEVTKAVEAFHEMNKAYISKAKTNMLADIFRDADLNATQGKMSFDKTLQNRFSTLYKGKKFDDFDPGEQKLIEKMARGRISTNMMNRLDRAFHFNIFGPIYRTMAAVPRAATSAAAERDAMKTLGAISGLPVPNPAAIPASLGVAAGVLGGQAGGQAGGAVPPVVPSAARGSAGLPSLTPAGQPSMPTFPEIPGLGGKVKVPGL